jgi:hypothetical protein
MKTSLRRRKDLSLLDFVPSPDVIRQRLMELESEQSQLKKLLPVSEEVTRERSQSSRPFETSTT